MLHSHAQFTVQSAPHSNCVRTVRSATSVRPDGLTDADDADDANYHGGVSRHVVVHKIVTILGPMLTWRPRVTHKWR